MDAIAQAFSVDKQGSTGLIVMYTILAVSIIGFGVIIERFIFLFFKYNLTASAFMAQIQKLLIANNIDGDCDYSIFQNLSMRANKTAT